MARHKNKSIHSFTLTSRQLHVPSGINPGCKVGLWRNCGSCEPSKGLNPTAPFIWITSCSSYYID